jgi:CspA family cold shock protein
MGKYRDHRSSRRRHEDPFSASDRPAEPSYFQHAQNTEPLSRVATVMWFNADRGFGFVKASDGTEAYLHVRTLEAGGASHVSEGTQLKVRINEGPKGSQVSQVLEVIAATAQTAPEEHQAFPASPRADDCNALEVASVGTVKFYKPEKGFGFISVQGLDRDVFVHASVLTRSGLVALTGGQKLALTYAKGHKGLEARTVKPI